MKTKQDFPNKNFVITSNYKILSNYIYIFHYPVNHKLNKSIKRNLIKSSEYRHESLFTYLAFDLRSAIALQVRCERHDHGVIKCEQKNERPPVCQIWGCAIITISYWLQGIGLGAIYFLFAIQHRRDGCFTVSSIMCLSFAIRCDTPLILIQRDAVSTNNVNSCSQVRVHSVSHLKDTKGKPDDSHTNNWEQTLPSAHAQPFKVNNTRRFAKWIT